MPPSPLASSVREKHATKLVFCFDLPVPWYTLENHHIFSPLNESQSLIQEECPSNPSLLSRPGQHWAVPSGINGRSVGLHVLSFILDSPFNDASVSPSEIFYFSSLNSIHNKDLNCQVFSHSTTKNHWFTHATCGRLKNAPNNVHVLFPEPVNVTLHEKKEFCRCD